MGAVVGWLVGWLVDCRWLWTLSFRHNDHSARTRLYSPSPDIFPILSYPILSYPLTPLYPFFTPGEKPRDAHQTRTRT